LLKKLFIVISIILAFVILKNINLCEFCQFSENLTPYVHLANIISGVATLVLALCALFALIQIDIMKKSNYAESFKWIMDKLDEVKPVQKKLLANKSFLNSLNKKCCIERYTDMEKELSQVINWYQRVSFMVNSGLLNKKYVREMWGIMFIKVWNSFGCYELTSRIIEKDNSLTPYLRKDFEKLAVDFYKYFYVEHKDYIENLLKPQENLQGYFDIYQIKPNFFHKIKFLIFNNICKHKNNLSYKKRKS